MVFEKLPRSGVTPYYSEINRVKPINQVPIKFTFNRAVWNFNHITLYLSILE